MPETTKTTFDLCTTLNLPGGPLGVIRAQGADAVKFLQGQLTQDVALLGLSEARLAAWCSAKGRMLASFVVFKNTHEDILLLCSTSVLPATLKRLQMFVMRAQCQLSDATAAYVVQGLAGAATGQTDALHATDIIATRATIHWPTERNSTQITIQLPPGHHAGHSVPRALRVQPVEAAGGQAADAKTPGQPALNHPTPSAASDLAVWQYLEVTTGIAPVTAPISDAFVPQMLNYESTGGVNFKKGCYPGQEVVARSQFRGTLKRRAFIVSSTAPLAAGQELFDSRDTEQPCGTVAYAAPQLGAFAGALAGHSLAIVSMQTSALDSPRLTAGSPDAATAALQLHALPYVLLDDI